ncbi:HNH endonuclease [Prosthecobacter sp.]|uniref:HNH endonuclease n=1 Tax=Prosthecobacter sp. TaxID=1965333 RepID=UPI003782F7F1
MSRVPASLAARVRTRAAHRCEYCRLPRAATQAPFEVEHIIPLKHEGPTTLENLAFACFHCNRHKGVNLCGLHPRTGKLIRLFDPRRDEWTRHFRLTDGRLAGKTDIGKATVQVLHMNKLEQVQLRRLWLA